MRKMSNRQLSLVQEDELDMANLFNIIQRRLSHLEAVQQAQTAMLAQLVAALERSTDLQQAQQTLDADLIDLQRRMLLVLERLADQVTPILQGIAVMQAELRDDHLVKSA
jgi:aminopeptidase N